MKRFLGMLVCLTLFSSQLLNVPVFANELTNTTTVSESEKNTDSSVPEDNQNTNETKDTDAAVTEENKDTNETKDTDSSVTEENKNIDETKDIVDDKDHAITTEEEKTEGLKKLGRAVVLAVPINETTVVAQPQGNEFTNARREGRDLAHSSLKQTGVFLKKGQQITIDNTQNAPGLSVTIGQFGVYKSLNDNKSSNPYDEGHIKSIGSGNNTYSWDLDGMVYIINSSETNTATVKISGGYNVPFYKLGETSQSQFNYMLDTLTESPFVEVEGKYTMATIQYEPNKGYLKSRDIGALLNYWDSVYAKYCEVSGLTIGTTGNQHEKWPNKLHITNPDTGPGYASATAHIVTFQEDTTAMSTLLTVDFKHVYENWGFWHEVGHTFQNGRMTFEEMGEVTVNLYSTYANEMVKGRLRILDFEDDVKQYLSLPQSQKDFIKSETQKIYPLWQLRMAYGDAFYPKVHKYLRDNSDTLLPNSTDALQNYILATSFSANRNLIPFFTQWGLYASDETKAKLNTLPALTVPIWQNLIDGRVVTDMSNNNTVIINSNVSELSLRAGDSGTISASISPSIINPALQYTSSNRAVVTVDSNGRYVATGVGTANIVITASNGLEKTIPVYVVNQISNINLNGKFNISASLNKNVSLDYAYAENPNVLLYTSHGGGNQVWTITSDGNGLHTIKNADSLTYLNEKVLNGQTFVASGAQTSKYIFIKKPNGSYVIQNAVTGKIIYINGGANSNTTLIMESYNKNTDEKSQFILSPLNQSQSLPTSITPSTPSINTITGAQGTVSVTIEPPSASGSQLSYSSTNSGVVTIDNSGNYTAVGVGQAQIVVRTVNGIETRISVNVTAPPQTTKIDGTFNIKTSKDQNYALDYAGFENPNVILYYVHGEPNQMWNIVSDNTGKHTIQNVDSGKYLTNKVVSGKNMLVADSVGAKYYFIPSGTTYIIKNATTNEIIYQNGPAASMTRLSMESDTKSSNVAAKFVLKTATTTVLPTGLTLNVSSINGQVGTTGKITATISPVAASGSQLSYSSTNAGVITVDSVGNYTAVGAGQAQLVVRTVNGIEARVSATVTAPIQNIKIDGTFNIKTSKDQNYALDYAKNENPNVILYYVHGEPNQMWKIVSDSTGKHTIQNVGSGQFLMNKTISGKNMLAADSVGAKYYFIKSGTAYVIKNAATNEIIYLNGQATSHTTLSMESEAKSANVAAKFVLKDSTVLPTSITPNVSSISGPVGKTGKITATIAPAAASGSQISYSSTNAGVITVDSAGNYTAVGAGQAQIVLRTVNGIEVRVPVTITAQAIRIDGTYNIRANSNQGVALDYAKNDNPNVILYYVHGEPNQMWKIVSDSTGKHTIQNVDSGKYLTNKVVNGKNMLVAGTVATKYYFVQSGTAYVIKNATTNEIIYLNGTADAYTNLSMESEAKSTDAAAKFALLK